LHSPSADPPAGNFLVHPLGTGLHRRRRPLTGMPRGRPGRRGTRGVSRWSARLAVHLPSWRWWHSRRWRP